MIKYQRTVEKTPLPFFHPVALLATFFGVGKIPFISGTWGSLATFPFLWVVFHLLPVTRWFSDNLADPIARLTIFLSIMLGLVVVLTVVGTWAANYYVRKTGVEDASAIVIDEVAGQTLTLAGTLPVQLMTPYNPMLLIVTLIASFVLFRLFDIVKPWPINWCDQNIKGGTGVMVDDLLAGLMAIVVFYALFFVYIDFFPLH